ncbi:TPA: DNA cytosine methyltransferase [Aeromonas veronii]
MIYGSVCSGVEAASLAWEPLGWNPAWFAEIEPFPSAVLANHWPHVTNLGDMTKIATAVLKGDVVAPDILVGGTPCQAFSVAGAREGLADDRGFLTIKYVELANAIDQKRAAAGAVPCITVWENVKGVLSSKDNAFGAYLGLLAGEGCELVPPGRKWDNAGCVYGPKRAIAWRVIDAKYFGAPQQRERVYVVSTARTDIDPARVLSEWQSLCGEAAQASKGRERCPFPVDGGTLYRFKRTDSYIEDQRCSTLTARDYKDARDLVVTHDGRVRGLSAEEYEIAMGFPVGHTAIPGSTLAKRRKALGNSMSVESMHWLGQRIDLHLSEIDLPAVDEEAA